MTASAHLDTFARDNLPPRAQWPDFRFDLPELQYPERMNCAVELLDRWVAAGHGERPCLIAPGETLTYAQLAERVNRIANVLTRPRHGPGHRVLLRGPNSLMMVAAYLAVIKAGGVVVATMPLLRAKEIAYPIQKAKIKVALCDFRLDEEMKARALVGGLERVVYWGRRRRRGARDADGEAGLRALRLRHRERRRVPHRLHLRHHRRTQGDHALPSRHARDLRQLRTARAARRSAGPFHRLASLAFTFGLGGLVLPLRVGAATILIEKVAPDDLLAAIANSAPRSHSPRRRPIAPCWQSSPRMTCRRFGNASPPARPCPRPPSTPGSPRPASDPRRHWRDRNAAHLHRFARGRGARRRNRPAGAGLRSAWLTPTATRLPPTPSAASPCAGTGCRYLADKRQRQYVQGGWNITGDTYLMDDDGYFWYQARSDDMIVSAGYNIAGPEVEAALLAHPAVAECGVVGAPDEERGQIVKAYVVLRSGHSGDTACTKVLQEHVKATIAPYKYPRAIEYVSQLPRTQTGKLQRFELRRMARARLAQARVLGRRGVPESLDDESATRYQRPQYGAAAAWLAAAEGLRQRHSRPRGNGVRRRHDRPGQGRPFRRRLRGADEARAREHRRGAGASGRLAAAHRAADLVRARHRRVSRRPACARRSLSRVMGRHFPAMAVVEVNRLVEPLARLRDRGDRGAAG